MHIRDLKKRLRLVATGDIPADLRDRLIRSIPDDFGEASSAKVGLWHRAVTSPKSRLAFAAVAADVLFAVLDFIGVAKLAVEVNELKLRKEEERFRNQLSTSYFVLQFQNDLATARNQYNKTLIDYALAVVEFQRARGTLLKDLNITIITKGN